MEGGLLALNDREFKDPVQDGSTRPYGIERLVEDVRADVALLLADDGDQLMVKATGGAPTFAPGATLPRDAPDVYSGLPHHKGSAVQGIESCVIGSLEPRNSPVDTWLAGLGCVERAVTRLVEPGSPSLIVDIASRAPLDRLRIEQSIGAHRAVLMKSATRGATPAVLVLVDEPVIADGLARRLENALCANARVVDTLNEALASVGVRVPDLLLVGDLRGAPSVVESARRLREAGAAAPLLAVVRADSPVAHESALAAGAAGYLPLGLAAERLADLAAELLDGHSAFARDAQPEALPRLTRREYDILAASERGLSHKQIASEFGIAISTVKTHARAVYRKLGAASRGEALYLARRRGLI